MSSSSNKSIYAAQLEQYRQSGNICAFLNLTIQVVETGKENELANKFAALEEADDLYMASSGSFLESILELTFPSILRQFIMARCSYEQQLKAFNTETVQNYFAKTGTMGYGSIVLPMLIVPSTVALLAALFNLSLLLVTIRKIPMATMCNWLLAFDSLCQIPALLPFLVNLVAVCARYNSVDFRVCLAMLMLSTGSLYASFMAVYLMSLERLMYMVMPMRMSQMSLVKQLSWLSFLLCVCFGLGMIRIVFDGVQNSVDSNANLAFDSCVYCNTGFHVFSLSMNTTNISHTILGLSVLNYFLMAALICWRRIFIPTTRLDSINSNSYSHATFRMLRSVFLISIVLIIGWLTGSLLYKDIDGYITVLTSYFGTAWFSGAEDARRFAYNSYNWAMGIVMCLFPMASGINAPMLFLNNSEYRDAYKKTFAPLFICRRNKTPSNAVSAAGVSPMFNQSLAKATLTN